jgi:hypothetical protein
MDEKRGSERKRIELTAVVRKPLSHQGYTLMEFSSRDLAAGGIFILAADLSLFDLGEELDILIAGAGRRFYEGKAKVVRSARVFSRREERLESGFGLMFEGCDPDFRRMLAHAGRAPAEAAGLVFKAALADEFS